MPFVEKFFEKKPRDLNSNDLLEFIDKELEENIHLDYKSGSLIENVKKLAIHVSAFANTEGGLLILGVDEDKVKNGNKTIRVYPKKPPTWIEPKFEKETLEKQLNAEIDPSVPIKIVPIRKSKKDHQVVFLIDIPKSNLLHLHNDKHFFYKRGNFESRPMSRDEVIDFIKIRLSFERCAWFRFHLEESLKSFMYEVLCTFEPDYLKQRKSGNKETVKRFSKLLSLPIDEIFNSVKQVTVRDSISFGKRDLHYFVNDLKEISEYSHKEITPRELVLFDKIIEDAQNEKEVWDKFDHYVWLSEQFSIQNFMNMSLLQFAEACPEEEHFLRKLHTYSKFLLYFLKDVFALWNILNGIKINYGDFRSSEAVTEIYGDS